MLKRTAFLVLTPLVAALAGDSPEISGAAPPVSDRTWTASLQTGFASTFQMTLGGTFGAGPDVQDKLTLGVNHVLLPGDTLSAFAWSTTDLPSVTPNWQSGLMYKVLVLRYRNHTLTFAGGVQRWLLPMVKTGDADWLAAGTLGYSTSVKGVPVVVTQDAWSQLRSTLPKGSVVYTQIYTQHSLLRRGGFQLLLRQGPQHTYSWGFYGVEGNRVLRYGGCLVLAWKNTSVEAGYRQQFGLQDGIHDNRYWSFLLTRQITKPFHAAE